MIQIKFDYSKLRGRIIEKYGTRGDFAQKVGRSLATVTNKVNGVTAFTQAEIVRWADALEIPPEEIALYFFKKAK